MNNFFLNTTLGTVLLVLLVDVIRAALVAAGRALDRRIPRLALWIARLAESMLPPASRQFVRLEHTVEEAIDANHRFGGLATAMSFLIRSAPILAFSERTAAERHELVVRGFDRATRGGIAAACAVLLLMATGPARRTDQAPLPQAAFRVEGYPDPPAGWVPPIDLPTADQIREVSGIEVAESIAEPLERLLSAARADGIELEGGGWRSLESQLSARRQNCGDTAHDIWLASSAACQPPTARPGSSQHQKGLAIDFMYEGETLCFPRTSSECTDNAGFKWLSEHADEYGFQNLPSEAWHWSTTGR